MLDGRLATLALHLRTPRSRSTAISVLGPLLAVRPAPIALAVAWFGPQHIPTTPAESAAAKPTAETLTAQAEVERVQGESDRAIVDYRRALATNPRYLPARLGLADTLWSSGDLPEARSAYQGIVDDFPPELRPGRAAERAEPTPTQETRGAR